MSKTKHFHNRANQRGIRSDLVELVRSYGVQQNDKTILCRKAINETIRVLDQMKKNLKKIADKGGLVVVESNGVLITVYRLD